MIFSSWRFLQKTKKQIGLYYNDTWSLFVFIRFLEEIDYTKETIGNELTFRFNERVKCFYIIFRWLSGMKWQAKNFQSFTLFKDNLLS